MSAAVFICHSSRDEGVALEVCEHLERRGIHCWYASRNAADVDDYTAARQAAVEGCGLVLLVYSAYANESWEVREDLECARATCKMIAVMRIEDVPPAPALKPLMDAYTPFDAVRPPLSSHLDRLLLQVRGMLGSREKFESRQAAESEGPRDRGAPSVINPERAIRLRGIDEGARQVVELARVLAVRCHAPEITHRILMAALVADPEGLGSRLCRMAGADPRLLWALLVAVSYKKGGPGEESVGKLPATAETCGRVLVPTIERARLLAGEGAEVTELHLLRAFCEQAVAGFAAFLKSTSTDEALEPVELDLADLRQLDPEDPGPLAYLSLRSRHVVRTAHQLARLCRVHPIPNRLLLAAFLLEDERFAHRVLRARRVRVDNFCKLLINSVQRGGEVSEDLNPEACARIVTPAVERARRHAGAGGSVTERLFWRSFCEVAEPVMKKQLREMGIDLDQLATASPDEPEGAGEPPPERRKPKRPPPDHQRRPPGSDQGRPDQDEPPPPPHLPPCGPN